MISNHTYIYGSGFNEQPFTSLSHNYAISDAVAYSKPWLSYTDGKALVDFTKNVDITDLRCFHHGQLAVKSSSTDVLTFDAEYIYVNGTAVLSYAVNGFTLMPLGDRIYIVPDTLIGQFVSLPTSQTSQNVAPFNRMIGVNFTFRIRYDTMQLNTDEFGNHPFIVECYKNGTLLNSNYSNFCDWNATNDTAVIENIKLLFDTNTDMASFDVEWYGLPAGTVFDISSTEEIYYLRVNGRYFRSYVDAVLHINENCRTDSSPSHAIDLSALFANSDTSTSDTMISNLQSMNTILQDEITNQIGLKNIAIADANRYNAELSGVNAENTAVKSAIASLNAQLAENLVTVQTALDEAAIAKSDAKFSDHYSTLIEAKLTENLASLQTEYDTYKASVNDQIATIFAEHEAYKLQYPYDKSTLTIPATLSSLNGVGCEHIDGTFVIVDKREGVYAIFRSYVVIVDDNLYTVTYDVMDEKGRTLSVPESMLTAVASVVTPV